MNRTGSIAGTIFVAALAASRPTLYGQEPNSTLDEQIRSQYRLTKVVPDGTVAGQAGSVLVIKEDGLNAIPASFGAYWYCSVKKGGHIRTNVVQHVGAGFRQAKAAHRVLQVGEKVYLTTIEFSAAEIAFYVQSCGTCDSSAADPNEAPYRARLAFEFDKGYLNTSNPKQVLEAIGQVFGIVATPPGTTPPLPTSDPAAQLKLPAAYVNAQTSTDQLRLNADNSFSLQEGGQTYQGTFVATGNTLEITIPNTNKTTMTVRGSTLTGPDGQIWNLREQLVPTAPGELTLRNEDIIKLTQVGIDDATMITKIGSSKCQFDTSTDALIRLKESGVSAAVLKAMIGAGR